MQITDEQFISAMEQAVKEKGPRHIGERTYWRGNAPACIVGQALGCINMDLVPRNNQQMANTLLPSMGVSLRVAYAAYAAQHLNDSDFVWEDVLDGFRFGLTFPDGASVDEVLHKVRMRAIDKKYGTNMNAHFTPATVTKFPIPEKITINFGDLYVAAGKATVSFGNLAEAFADVKYDAKKDHTLVA